MELFRLTVLSPSIRLGYGDTKVHATEPSTKTSVEDIVEPEALFPATTR